MNRPRRVMVLLSAVMFLLGGIAACGRDPISPRAAHATSSSPSLSRGSSGISGSSSDDPYFLTPAPGAPSILNPVIVFTVQKGVDKVVKMYYQPRRPGDSTVFAQFRVPQDGLASRPDGTPIANGESVQITMTLIDADKGIIDFQPSGLRFSTKHSATLKISYRFADPDLNHDGVVDFRDTLLRQMLHMICRETPNDPWTPIPSANNTDLDEVQAAILGFTGYAIEY
ncbi:MAG: hypothetical protein JWM41_4792 [Gemmatimonadetes bacterium]|nr:hypothetical protein [Gemmatimonadota bacterium]